MTTEIRVFKGVLKHYQKQLTWQEYSTLKGQALKGDIEGAKKGLINILARRPNVKTEQGL